MRFHSTDQRRAAISRGLRVAASFARSGIPVASSSLWLCVDSVAEVNTVGELVAAINNGAANSTVLVGAGTFQLTAPLVPKVENIWGQ